MRNFRSGNNKKRLGIAQTWSGLQNKQPVLRVKTFLSVSGHAIPLFLNLVSVVLGMFFFVIADLFLIFVTWMYSIFCAL